MPIEVSFQLSLGRFTVLANDGDSLRDLKKKLRLQYASQLLQVNVNQFRLCQGSSGKYFSDESAKVKDSGINNGDVLHFVKKNACAAAQLDTEEPVDE